MSKKSIIEKAKESMDNLKTNKGTLDDLKLVLSILQDNSIIKRSLGERRDSTIEANYISNSLMYDLIEFCKPLLKQVL